MHLPTGLSRLLNKRYPGLPSGEGALNQEEMERVDGRLASWEEMRVRKESKGKRLGGRDKLIYSCSRHYDPTGCTVVEKSYTARIITVQLAALKI